MKRFILAAVALLAVLMGLTALMPSNARAEGCPSQGIAPWTTFTLDYQCSLTGDVFMGQYPNGIQQFDNDANTGLVVTCGIPGGCPGYTVAYGASKTSVDANTAASQLRASGCISGCWNGVTQVYWTGGYTPPVFNPPPVFVPPTAPTRQYFGIGQSVLGGTIVIGNQSYYGCYIAYAWTSGYVDYGFVNPAYTFGYNSSCGTSSPPPVYNPCPSGGIAPYCTVNGQPERSYVGTWSRLSQGEAAYGDQILLDNNRACSIGNCYVQNASSGGWIYNGWVNPQTWRIPAITVNSW